MCNFHFAANPILTFPKNFKRAPNEKASHNVIGFVQRYKIPLYYNFLKHEKSTIFFHFVAIQFRHFQRMLNVDQMKNRQRFGFI